MTNLHKQRTRRDLVLVAGMVMCVASLGFALYDYGPDSGDLLQTHDVITDHVQPGASYSVEARDLKYGDVRGLVLKWRSSGHFSSNLATVLYFTLAGVFETSLE